MKKIVIAGGAGLLGRSLCDWFLSRGHDVTVLSRSKRGPRGAKIVEWDSRKVGDWAEALEDADALYNLSGSPVSVRWTPDARQSIIDSRVGSTTTLAEALARAKNPPKVWLNASAVGFYGDTGDHTASEATKAGEGFLPEVCQAWEKAFFEPVLPGIRRVALRSAVVLSNDDGALPEFKKVLAAGFGSGKQFISWIHIEDWCGLAEWAMTEDITGPINLTSPHSLPNAEFFRTLNRELGRPALPTIPEFVFKPMAKAMGMEPSVALESSRVSPVMALARGFHFRYPELTIALEDLLQTRPAAWVMG